MQTFTKQLLLRVGSRGGLTPICCSLPVRHRSITGHMPTDVALKSVTGGRVDRWMQGYEDLVGLTEVKEAQNNVIQAERQFLTVQEDRRQQQQVLEMIQSRLRAISADLEKTNRADVRYLDLVHKEHAIIQEEGEVVTAMRVLEKRERETFALLSSALRDSHEKERGQAERTKYWSVIGSVVGVVLGVAGTSLNNHLKMKELRGIVSRAGESGEDLRRLSTTLCESVRQQSTKLDGLLLDLRHTIIASDPDPNIDSKVKAATKAVAVADLEKIRLSPSATDLRRQTEEILGALKSQERNLDGGIQEIRRLVGVERSLQSVSGGGGGGGPGDGGEDMVVYVGPQVQVLMKQTEENLERKIKYSALASATLVYAALALTVPVALAFFRGGGA